MGRPPLEPGPYGTIRSYKTDTGYQACTKARGYDGATGRWCRASDFWQGPLFAGPIWQEV